jgi:hypothetical protein
MALAPERIETLMTALLAVNGYRVDAAAALMPAFRTAGLLDHQTVAALDYDAVVERMVNAGYRRGGYVPIVSYRVMKTLEAAAAGVLDDLDVLATSNQKDGFIETLRGVHGFGPRTAELAWSLWTGE